MQIADAKGKARAADLSIPAGAVAIRDQMLAPIMQQYPATGVYDIVKQWTDFGAAGQSIETSALELSRMTPAQRCQVKVRTAAVQLGLAIGEFLQNCPAEQHGDGLTE